MTNKQLQARLKFWQKRLRLQDWDITAEFSLAKDIQNEGALGETRIIPNWKTADIKLLSVSEMSEDDLRNGDIEQTLVHELLHLHTDALFYMTDQSKPLSIINEQLIEAISHALVELDRK